MTWTSPKTWASSGELLTGALLNTHLRDNLLSIRNLNDYSCRRYLLSSAVITTNIDFPVIWSSSPLSSCGWNFGGVWASGGPRRMTAPVTGWWDLKGSLLYDNNSSGVRGAGYQISGSTAVTHSVDQRPAVNGDFTACPFMDTIYLTSGQSVEVTAWHTRGSNLSLNYDVDGSFVVWKLAGTTA